MFTNFRIYGSALLLVVIAIVALGVKFVQCFAPISLFCVIISILSVYIGAFVATPDNSPQWNRVFYGLVSINADIYLFWEFAWLATDSLNPIRYLAWMKPTGATKRSMDLCTMHTVPSWTMQPVATNSWLRMSDGLPAFQAFSATCFQVFSRTTSVEKIYKMKPGIYSENARSKYMDVGEVAPGKQAQPRHEVYQDIETNFFIILAIFFPSVTGVFTGANMSGRWNTIFGLYPNPVYLLMCVQVIWKIHKNPCPKAPSRLSWPRLLCTYLLYWCLVAPFMVPCFETSWSNMIRWNCWLFKHVSLRYGDSLNNRMIVAELAWPNEWVLLIGSFLSTFGAALQCLCSMQKLNVSNLTEYWSNLSVHLDCFNQSLAMTSSRFWGFSATWRHAMNPSRLWSSPALLQKSASSLAVLTTWRRYDRTLWNVWFLVCWNYFISLQGGRLFLPDVLLFRQHCVCAANPASRAQLAPALQVLPLGFVVAWCRSLPLYHVRHLLVLCHSRVGAVCRHL